VSKIWDALASVVITALVIWMLLELIRPYTLIMLVLIALGFVLYKVYTQSRRW
jgi:hypothetical protein